MSRDAVNLYLLVIKQDVVAYFEHTNRGIKVGAHEVGQIKLVMGRAHKQRATFSKSGNGLAWDIIIGHQSTAVGISRERMVVEFAIYFVHIDRHAQKLLVFLEDVYPGI